MEDELVTLVDNGSLAQAQDIMSSSLDLAPFAAERMGAFGEFEIREIPFFAGENFESGGFGGRLDNDLQSGRWADSNYR